MKLQEIKINNRFEHVIDYDSTNVLEVDILDSLGIAELAENFVISYEPYDGWLPLISFQTNNNTLNDFTLETDKSTDSCQLTKGALTVVNEDNHCTDLLLELDFSYYKQDDKSRHSGGTHATIFSNKRDDNNAAYLPQILPANDKNNAVVAEVRWNMSMIPNVHCLSLAFNEPLRKPAKVVVRLGLNSPGLSGGDRRSLTTMVVYVAPSKQITDVVLDFGSESSQMSIIPREHAIDESNKVELFTELFMKYGKDKEKETDFYQYDEASTKFFKSHFFIKKTLTSEVVQKLHKEGMSVTMDEQASSGEGLAAEADVMRFLTSKFDVQQMKSDYMVAPNVKLTGFGGISMPKVKVDSEMQATDKVAGEKSYFYYRLGISIFLREALDEIAKSKQHMQLVSFHILMPNIYMQSEIVEILQLLQIDIQKLLMQDKYKMIKGFEVTAVSESDASMMGVSELMRNMPGTNALENGNYLLLDAGKGTLDFSLVHYEFKGGYHTYQNRWRSGIVGAGNSLTYAYLLALIDEYLTQRCEVEGAITESHIQQFIYQNILGLDSGTENKTITYNPADLLNMMRAVDKYKCCKKFTAKQVRGSERVKKAPLEDLSLQGFLGWLESGIDVQNQRIEPVSDKKKFIGRMIAALVDETVNRIKSMQVGRAKDFQINYVIFAGRAFKLDAFKIKMKNALLQKYNNVKEVKFTSPNVNLSMKDICLVCVEPLIVGTYNRKICSLPVLLQEGVKQTLEEQPDEKKKKKGFLKRAIEFITGEESPEESIETPCCQSSTKSKMLEGFINIAGLEGSYTASGSGEKKVYVYNPQNLRLNIGGYIKPVQGVTKEYVELFYMGKHYAIRTSKTLIRLEALMNFTRSNFVQSSFFPYIPIEAMHELILIPKEEQQSPEVHANSDETEVPHGEDTGQKRKKVATNDLNSEDEQLRILLEKHK